MRRHLPEMGNVALVCVYAESTSRSKFGYVAVLFIWKRSPDHNLRTRFQIATFLARAETNFLGKRENLKSIRSLIHIPTERAERDSGPGENTNGHSTNAGQPTSGRI